MIRSLIAILFCITAWPALAQPLDARNNLSDVKAPTTSLGNINGMPNRVIIANRLHGPDGARTSATNYQSMNRIVYTSPTGARDMVVCYSGWNTNPYEFAIAPANFVPQAVAVSNPGTGYAVDDVIALPSVAYSSTPAGTARVTRVRVIGISGGGATGPITSAAIEDPGIYSAPVIGAQAQASTSGSGTGATFTLSSYSEFATHVRAAVEPLSTATQSTTGLSAIRPLKFGGSQNAGTTGGTAGNNLIVPSLDGEVLSGKVLCSDPIDVYIPPGGTFAVRTWTNGTQTSFGYIATNANDYVLIGLPVTDQSQSGTIGTTTPAATPAYGPSLILGTPVNNLPSHAIFGTSIEWGETSAGNQDLGDAAGNDSWIERANGVAQALVSFGSSANQMSFLFDATHGRQNQYDMITRSGATDIGIFLSVNDFTNCCDEATVLAEENQVSAEVRGIRSVRKVYTSTGTPFATSSANTTAATACARSAGVAYTNTNGVEIRNALLRVGLIPFSGGVGGTYAAPATGFTSGTSTISTGSQTVTPTQMSLTSGGATFSIVPGVQIIVDVGGANVETVTPTATNATLTNGYPTALGSTFTATFAKTHTANVAMTVYSPYYHDPANVLNAPGNGAPGGGFDFVIDFGTALESSLGSCLWAITSDTGDGLHPSYLTISTGGHAHMATIAAPIITANQ